MVAKLQKFQQKFLLSSNKTNAFQMEMETFLALIAINLCQFLRFSTFFLFVKKFILTRIASPMHFKWHFILMMSLISVEISFILHFCFISLFSALKGWLCSGNFQLYRLEKLIYLNCLSNEKELAVSV